ncbi:MAG: DUF2333 family protein [Desulfatiglans sp.]|jgi:hypothetical protein|nr:DUF2333 family protein [Desulfatiglans sp.]
MNTKSDKTRPRNLKVAVIACIALLFLFAIVVMAVNSRKPPEITNLDFHKNVKGAAFIRTNQILIKQMADNWLPNDILWPTVLLDNMPNFQIGELEVVRYNMRILRDNLTRMRTTDKLDPHAEAAFTSLSNDPYKWLLPSAESKWRQGLENLDSFYLNLVEGKSNFYARADNLVELLGQYASLMGGANTRLINAPRDIDKSLEVEQDDPKAPEGHKMVDIDIPWYKIDDNFYYAQGIAYALHQSFKAIRIDFIDVLEDKNSVRLIDKILENLERCRFEPLIVFNGDPGSIFANHSLNLSGMFNDSRQKINSLIIALMQG